MMGMKKQQVYYTNNDNSSIKDGNNDSDTDLPGLVEQTSNGYSSSDDNSDDQYIHEDSDSKPEDPHQYFPTSINTIPSTIDWHKDEGDEYNGDNNDDNDDMPRLATWYPTDTPGTTSVTIPTLQTSPLWLQGGNGSLQVEIVTVEDPNDVSNTEENLHNNVAKRSTPTPPLTQKPEYDPIADESPPAVITPSYVPIHKKNEH